MGKEDSKSKASVPNEDGQESVFDNAFSKLLDNFSCASLFSSSPEKGRSTSSCSCCWDDLVATLKHFHICQPINSQRKVRKLRRRRNGVKSSNGLNLSVAAGCIHRPVVWPSRLNRSRVLSCSKILLPSRLCVGDSDTEQHSLKCKILQEKRLTEVSDIKEEVVTHMKKNTGLHQGSSLLHKIRKGTGGEKKVSRVFGTLNNLEGKAVNSLSFHQAPSNLFSNGENVQEDNGRTSQPPIVHFRQYRCSSIPPPASNIRASGYIHSTPTYRRSEMSHPHLSDISSVLDRAPSGLEATSSLASALPSSEHENLPVSRSCSQEMKMEETNVNELASYFEDLVHIPRKMSIMAEMMYA